MKILGVAIARTVLLNLAASIYLLDFSPPYPLLSVLISSLIFILAIAYVNQCIGWKRQGGKLLDLIRLQRTNLGHGVEAFIILVLTIFLPLLGAAFYEENQTSSTNEMYQPSDTEIGLIVIGVEISAIALYILNEHQKQQVALKKQKNDSPRIN